MKIFIALLQIMLVGVFTFFGLMKVIGAEEMVVTFQAFGYSDLFMRLVGVVEVTAALLLILGFWKRNLILWAGVAIIILTIGATYSHIFLQQLPAEAIPPVIVGSLAALILYLNNRYHVSANSISSS